LISFIGIRSIPSCREAANLVVESTGKFRRSTSSAKYKTDIETLQDSYADALLSCRPVWYRSTCAGDNPDWGWWGFIAEEVAEIEILKPHGSLNFSMNGTTQSSSPFLAVDDPLILPPIFNKMTYGDSLNNVWAKALQRLRQTKNVFIVGYSLPSTDIYVQYFLKAGLGPNTNLNCVFVYDPVLCRDDTNRNNMIERYRTCFSPQLQKRIKFTTPHTADPTPAGSLYEFVTGMSNILF